MTPDTIQTDVTTIDTGGLDLHSAEEAFLTRWKTDEETPSGPGEEEDSTKETPETSEGDDVEEIETDDETEGTDEDPDGDNPEDKATEPAVAADDAIVEFTVDGQTQRVSVKELKRLAGQEASLTRKSQEIAAYRQNLEAETQRNAMVLNQLHQKAVERLKPYKDIDLFKASRELSSEDFDALRNEMKAAEADVKFFEQEIVTLVDKHRSQRAEALKQEVPEALKVIRDKIPEWSDTLYNDIRSYAVAQGMKPEVVNEIIDPPAVVMMHKAMLFDRAQKSVKEKVQKVAQAPKKVLKTDGRSDTKSKPKAALERLATSGGIDDAAAVLLARWGSK